VFAGCDCDLDVRHDQAASISAAVITGRHFGDLPSLQARACPPRLLVGHRDLRAEIAPLRQSPIGPAILGYARSSCVQSTSVSPAAGNGTTIAIGRTVRTCGAARRDADATMATAAAKGRHWRCGILTRPPPRRYRRAMRGTARMQPVMPA